MSGRELLEVQLFFAVWALCLLHALLRPHLRAWIEQFYVAALLAVLLPVVNVVTAGQWLGTYAVQGDTARLGLELVTVGIGMTLAGVAWTLSRKPGGVPQRLAPEARRHEARA
jgi:predicted phage tail protein